MAHRRFIVDAARLMAVLVIGLAGSARGAGLSFQPTHKQGLFLHVSDIHFDPFADRALFPKLAAAPAARWQAIFRTAKNTPFPRRGHADTTWPLFASMLSAAHGLSAPGGERVHYDYVLNTGDNLAHDFHDKFKAAGGQERDYEAFVVKTLRFVDLMLTKRFAGAPLIYAPGNNDAVCGDYEVAPNSAMLRAIGRDLPVVAGNAQARRDFAIGGFYVTPHPTVPKHDIIALNSVFWSVKYKDACNHGGDPGAAELDWLAWTLYREQAAGHTVTLAMHIPPGINGYTSSQQACPRTGTSFWRAGITRRFAALMAQYKGIVTASYAGHTHMDDFRVMSDGGTPLLATRITPAVTPLFGNNPAFAVMLYDRGNAVVDDSAIFYLTNVDYAGPKVRPDWRQEYDFARTYGVKTYTAAVVAGLAGRIAKGGNAASHYRKFYPVTAPTPINAGALKAYACAQTSLTPAAYAACRCPPPAPQAPK